MVVVRFAFVDDGADRDALVPKRATAGAAGFDLVAAGGLTLAPGKRGLVPTGVAVAIPAGFEGQVRPRSGLALKHGITCLNAPGTIDSDYRGEIKVILVNHGEEPFVVTRGMRVAQLVIAAVAPASFELVAAVADLDETERKAGGFGSTGL